MPVPETVIVEIREISLGSAITVKLPRIYHEVKLPAHLLQFQHQTHGILDVDVVVCCSMSEHQIVGCVSLVAGSLDAVCHHSSLETLRIPLRSVHETLCVVGIIEHVVVNASTGNSVFEILTPFGNAESCHASSIRETVDSYLVRIDIRKVPEVLGPFYEVFEFNGEEVAVHEVAAFLATVAAAAVVHAELYHILVCPPLVAR